MAAAHGVDVMTAAAHLYRDTSRTIYTGLQAHFNDTRLSDIVLVRPDGRVIYAHQVILASCSRKFASVLCHGDAAGKELPIQGVDSPALESVIGYFYRGECLLSPITVVPIYDVCLKLEVPGLSAGCEQYLQQNLNPQTCPIFLEAAYQLMLDQVLKMCLEYAQTRFDDIVAATTFQSLSAEVVRLLLKQTRSSTGDVAMARALARWALRRPEHLAECEAMFKELNVTASALLQLFQSPDFVQTLQQGHDTAAQRAEGSAAGTAAAAAVGLGASRPGAAAAGRAAAATVNAAAASSSGAAGGGLLSGDDPAVGAILQFREPLDAVEVGGGVAATAQLLPAFGSSVGQHRPSTASSGGRSTAEDGEGGGGGELSTLAGRRRGLHAASGGKLLTLSAPTAPDGAAGGPSGSGGRPPAPVPPLSTRRSYQQQLQPMDVSGPGTEGAWSGWVTSARAHMSASDDGRGDNSGTIAAAGSGALDDVEVQREVSAVRRTGTRAPAVEFDAGGLRIAGHVSQQDDSSPDGGGGSGGGMFAVPLSALEQAGLTVQFLPSGSLAVSGVALGSQQLPLQVVPAGPGPQAALLALLPMALLPQLQRPATATGGVAQQDAAPQPQPGLAEAAVALQHLMMRGGEPLLRSSGQGASKAVAQQLRLSGMPAPSQVGRIGGGGGDTADASGGGGSSRSSILFEAVADSGVGGGNAGVSLKREHLEPEVLPGFQMLALRSGVLPLEASGRGAGPTALLDPPTSRSGVAGSGAGATAAIGGALMANAIAAFAAAAAAAQATVAPPKQPRSVAGIDMVSGAGAGGSVAAVGGGTTGLPRGIAARSPQRHIGGTSTDPREHAVARWSLPGGGATTYAPPLQLLGPGGIGRAASLPAHPDILFSGNNSSAELCLGLGLGLGQGAGLGSAGGAGKAAGKRRRASPSDDDPDHVEESDIGRGAGSGRGGRYSYGGRSGAGGDCGTSSTPGQHTSKPTLTCHVDDCHVDLSCLKEYHQRFRICDFHLKAEVVTRDGIPQRFCQQCGRFHVLSEFDGTKRSCRARLQRHNARRRKRPEQRGSGGDGGSDESRKPSRPATAGGAPAQQAPPYQTLSQQQLLQQQQQRKRRPLHPQLPSSRAGVQELAALDAGAGDEIGLEPGQDGPDEDTLGEAAAADSLQQLQQELMRLQEGQSLQLQQELQLRQRQQYQQRQQQAAGLWEPAVQSPQEDVQRGTALVFSEGTTGPQGGRRQEQQPPGTDPPMDAVQHEDATPSQLLEEQHQQEKQRDEEGVEDGERRASEVHGGGGALPPAEGAEGGGATTATVSPKGVGGTGAGEQAPWSAAAQPQNAGPVEDCPPEKHQHQQQDGPRLPLGTLPSGNNASGSGASCGNSQHSEART